MILLQAKLKRTLNLKRLIPEEMLALENLYGKNKKVLVVLKRGKTVLTSVLKQLLELFQKLI